MYKKENVFILGGGQDTQDIIGQFFLLNPKVGNWPRVDSVRVDFDISVIQDLKLFSYTFSFGV